jgi:hypothetical protein
LITLQNLNMRILDHIPEIQELLKQETSYRIGIGITGTSARNRAPKVRVQINGQLMFDQSVDRSVDLIFDVDIVENRLDLCVEYHDRSDQDTVIIDGCIVENQHVTINYIDINGVCVSGYELHDIGQVKLTLSPEQGLRDHELYNNGQWHLTLFKPFLSNLTRHKRPDRQVFETSHLDVLEKLQQYFKDDRSCGTAK